MALRVLLAATGVRRATIRTGKKCPDVERRPDRPLAHRLAGRPLIGCPRLRPPCTDEAFTAPQVAGDRRDGGHDGSSMYSVHLTSEGELLARQFHLHTSNV